MTPADGPEAIRLNCGVVLRLGNIPGAWFGVHDEARLFAPREDTLWTARWFREQARYDSRENCLSWLDEKIVTLRRALLPDGVRDQVARVIWARMAEKDVAQFDADTDDEAKALYRADADAILTILSGGSERQP